MIAGGVKIYEYTPGFVHAKSFVADDKMAVVGTVNMDYRSYYLHYECGIWFYRSSVVMDVKKDFLATLEKSHQVTLEECTEVSIFVRILRAILYLLDVYKRQPYDRSYIMLSDNSIILPPIFSPVKVCFFWDCFKSLRLQIIIRN